MKKSLKLSKLIRKTKFSRSINLEYKKYICFVDT